MQPTCSAACCTLMCRSTRRRARATLRLTNQEGALSLFRDGGDTARQPTRRGSAAGIHPYINLAKQPGGASAAAKAGQAAAAAAHAWQPARRRHGGAAVAASLAGHLLPTLSNPARCSVCVNDWCRHASDEREPRSDEREPRFYGAEATMDPFAGPPFQMMFGLEVQNSATVVFSRMSS